MLQMQEKNFKNCMSLKSNHLQNCETSQKGFGSGF